MYSSAQIVSVHNWTLPGSADAIWRLTHKSTLLVRQMVQMKIKISTLLMEAGVSYNEERLHKAGYFRELQATNPDAKGRALASGSARSRPSERIRLVVSARCNPVCIHHVQSVPVSIKRVGGCAAI